MMHIRTKLLTMLLGQARRSLLALPLAALWVIGCRTPLFEPAFGVLPLPFLFIFLHSMAIVALLGQPRSASVAFLYSRGYSRDTLWAHQVLASLVHALLVWLPASALIWIRLRAGIQFAIFENPLQPLLAPRESLVPWRWLAAYGLFLPMLHYVWIRQAQPARNPDAGAWLSAAFGIALFTAWNAPGSAQFTAPWFMAMLWAAGILLSLALLVGGWRLHRDLEVGR